jgi:hypothetical protein
MKIAKSVLGVAARQGRSVKKSALLMLLLATMVSGCSTLANSHRFYGNHAAQEDRD